MGCTVSSFFTILLRLRLTSLLGVSPRLLCPAPASCLLASLAGSLAGSLAQEWDQKQQQPEHLQNIMSCNGHDGSHVTNISSHVS